MNPLLQAAEGYAAQGIRVLPYGKDDRCIGKWADAGDTPESALENFRRKCQTRKVDVIALMTGGRFDALDIDGEDALQRLKQMVGGLPQRYGIVRTPSGGYHAFIPVLGRGNGADLLGDASGHNGVDYRGRGGIVFAVPSQRKGGMYEWLQPLDFERPGVDVDQWREYIDRIVSVGKKKVDHTPAQQTNSDTQASDDVHPWLQKKLDAKLGELRNAGAGSRNQSLNRVAVYLGHYVPHLLAEAQVTEALVDACEVNGLVGDDGQSSVRATIRSGLTKGKSEPRQVPQSTKKQDAIEEFVDLLRNAPEEPKNNTEKLLELVRERYEPFLSVEGEVMAVPYKGHVAVPLDARSERFNSELVRIFYDRYGEVPPELARKNVVALLVADAYQRPPIKAHLRVAETEGAIWVDMGDHENHVIRITGDDWEVTTTAKAVFRRTALTAQLPKPEHGGDLGLLWGMLNVQESDRPLLLGWMIAALAFPNVPHPILTFTGQQGVGKSSASRIVSRLIDPSAVDTHSAPRNREQVFDAISGSYVVGIDNVSQISHQVSDELCSAVTGGGNVTRKLYTNRDKSVAIFRSAIIMNGITLGDLQGDLAERMLPIELERIPDDKRRTEAEINAQWKRHAPQILGALLDIAVKVRMTIGSVKLSSLPRMADFARILAALDLLNGTESLRGYHGKSVSMASEAIDSNQFLALMNDQLKAEFNGSPSELLELLKPSGDAPRWWPTPRKVSSILDRGAPSLQANGWEIDRRKNTTTKRYEWRIVPPTAVQPYSRTQQPEGKTPSQRDLTAVTAVTAVGSESCEPCRLHGTKYEPDYCYTCEQITGDLLA